MIIIIIMIIVIIIIIITTTTKIFIKIITFFSSQIRIIVGWEPVLLPWVQEQQTRTLAP